MYNPVNDTYVQLIAQSEHQCKAAATGQLLWKWRPNGVICARKTECLNSLYWDWPNDTVYVTAKHSRSIVKLSHSSVAPEIVWVLSPLNHTTLCVEVSPAVRGQFGGQLFRPHKRGLHGVQMAGPHRLAVFQNGWDDNCGYGLLIEVNEASGVAHIVDAMMPCQRGQRFFPPSFGGFFRYHLGLLSFAWGSRLVWFTRGLGGQGRPTGLLTFKYPSCIPHSYRIDVVPLVLFVLNAVRGRRSYSVDAVASTSIPIAKQCDLLLQCTKVSDDGIGEFVVTSKTVRLATIYLPRFQALYHVKLMLPRLGLQSCVLHWHVLGLGNHSVPLSAGVRHSAFRSRSAQPMSPEDGGSSRREARATVVGGGGQEARASSVPPKTNGESVRAAPPAPGRPRGGGAAGRDEYGAHEHTSAAARAALERQAPVCDTQAATGKDHRSGPLDKVLLVVIFSWHEHLAANIPTLMDLWGGVFQNIKCSDTKVPNQPDMIHAPLLREGRLMYQCTLAFAMTQFVGQSKGYLFMGDDQGHWLGARKM